MKDDKLQAVLVDLAARFLLNLPASEALDDRLTR